MPSFFGTDVSSTMPIIRFSSRATLFSKACDSGISQCYTTFLVSYTLVFGTCSVSCVSETWKASPLRRSYKHTHCLLACIYTHERSLVHVDTCMSDDSTENQITVISGEYVQFAGCGTWITQCSPAGFFSENQHRAHMWDKLQLNPALRGRSGLFVDYTY